MNLINPSTIKVQVHVPVQVEVQFQDQDSNQGASHHDRVGKMIAWLSHKAIARIPVTSQNASMSSYSWGP